MSDKLISGPKVGDGPTMGEDLQEIAWKNKNNKLVQLTWDNIEITALPPSGKCGKRNKNALKEPKVIIDGVSGTAMPGQFIAIIGASGKFNLHLIPCGNVADVILII